MKGSTNPLGGIPCPGCPIYPHSPDEQFRFPSCELCHWPAIGIGSRHVWRCAYCRHWNEHGLLRPRVSAVLLRLENIGPAARRLDVVDPRYGRYLIPQTRHSPCQPRTPYRPEIPALSGASRWPGGRGGTGGGVAHGSGTGHGGAAGGGGWARGAGRERAGRTVWARAAVAGLPVLIVGGDRPHAYPLGLAEQDPEPCSFGSRATRIACPCDQPPRMLNQVMAASAPLLGGLPMPMRTRTKSAVPSARTTGPQSFMPVWGIASSRGGGPTA